MIELQGLTRTYREGPVERTVLQGLDLTVARGERVALIGRSGSGKSTLLNLVGGIDLPNSGRLVVAGIALAQLGEAERTRFRRRHIGFVYQFFNLIPTLTVEENVRLPLELNGRREQEPAAALLEQVGLGDRLDSFPDALSGGEQQRVALARALVHEPALLLADEPTGNLDERTGGEVISLIDRLTRERGVTLLMVTHGRETLTLADRVLELTEGRVRERPACA